MQCNVFKCSSCLSQQKQLQLLSLLDNASDLRFRFKDVVRGYAECTGTETVKIPTFCMQVPTDSPFNLVLYVSISLNWIVLYCTILYLLALHCIALLIYHTSRSIYLAALTLDIIASLPSPPLPCPLSAWPQCKWIRRCRCMLSNTVSSILSV